ncbi:MAG: hypothetical protein GXY02_08910 [Actinobacteria bacterium]|nr:hypothetical protein [Actinomycetota bacterium]
MGDAMDGAMGDATNDSMTNVVDGNARGVVGEVADDAADGAIGDSTGRKTP